MESACLAAAIEPIYSRFQDLTSSRIARNSRHQCCPTHPTPSLMGSSPCFTKVIFPVEKKHNVNECMLYSKLHPIDSLDLQRWQTSLALKLQITTPVVMNHQAVRAASAINPRMTHYYSLRFHRLALQESRRLILYRKPSTSTCWMTHPVHNPLLPTCSS